MKLINLTELKTLAQKLPEVKRLCLLKHAPVYLLQMELERYNLRLAEIHYKELKNIKV